ncbi:PREDICTED: dual specificity tyrosine-phosphorylation-regulated kinase 2-like isoform X2 [Lupinus angustifolius]|uniref:dual specificity tyrosine-phosphorylation-regulated kinase 2-like isoform X2 n=1 Tax=Lupinus angustifolius TaxID=3871 RepID=UPI00092FC8A8|nr:PREDICTED: dual specificity tyrosine-phosphorylation-regulated kinase 2-like isoform X2 [Lupinus angustifolius]
MAVSNGVETVIEFLRKNGFSEAESALKQDIIDKVGGSHLTSFDYDKFYFPMLPPLPPVRLRSSEPAGGVFSVSSDDEFFSIGSIISRVSSSEFINPHGICSVSQTRNGSEYSSDYHDFDMQNESYWYNENDDECFMTPNFEGADAFGCRSEDKFVMTSKTENQYDHSLGLNHNYEESQFEGNGGYMDKACLNNSSLGDGNDTFSESYCHMDNKNQINEDSTSFSYRNLNEINLNDFRLKVVGDITSFNSAPQQTVNQNLDYYTKNDSNDGYKGPYDLTNEVAGVDPPNAYEAPDGGELAEECQDPKIIAYGEDTTTDVEVLKYSQDDEHEVFDLRIIHRKNRTGYEENKEMPIVLNTIIAGRYYVTEYLGSAAFSRVVQAYDLQRGIDVCLKIIKNDKDFFDQSLDEIRLLRLVNKHDPADECHILRLYDYFYYQEHLFLVTELLQANLYEYQKFNQESGGEAYFTLSRLQIITRQCLEALQYLHNLGIVHCDLKPENILIKSYKRCKVKVIDLGSSCFKTDNLCLYVQSRSYRAPEVMLGLQYDEKIDIWSLGCILAELCSGEVLFPNDPIVMILARMIGILGPIDLEMLVKGQETHKYFTEEYDIYHVNEETNQLEYIIPESTSLEQHLHVTDTMFVDFVKYLLNINPKRRPTATQALKHPWISYMYKSK